MKDQRWWASEWTEPDEAMVKPRLWRNRLLAFALICLTAPPVSMLAVRSISSLSDSPATRQRVIWAASDLVERENAKLGTRAWELRGEQDGSIEGFAAPINVLQGNSVRLYVSTTADSYDVDVYRMGWYGGTGARRVARERGLRGRVQAAPRRSEAPTYMVEASWRPSVRFDVTRAWTSGVYLAVLRSDQGSDYYVPFIVRDDRPATYLVQLPVTTWLAYNVWGGRSTYKDVSDPTAPDREKRSRVASLDRPFSRLRDGRGEAPTGAEEFLRFEYPLVRFIERRGFDVTYATSFETHSRPDLLLSHAAVVSVGHDEYWSRQMRDNLEAARDAGVGLAFFGANVGYRSIRLERSPLGQMRRMVHYKNPEEDPLLASSPADVAATWRTGPLNRPESGLLGIMYVCDPVDAPWRAGDTSHWAYRGTGFREGDQIEHLVGHEYDRSAASSPVGLEVISESPVTCGGRRDVAHTTVYRAPSGSLVFAAGTIRWSWGLDDWGPNAVADERLQRLTTNILRAFERTEGVR